MLKRILFFTAVTIVTLSYGVIAENENSAAAAEMSETRGIQIVSVLNLLLH